MSKFVFSGKAALARALIGVLGGYALAIAFISGGSGLLVAVGAMGRADAVVSTGMLGFLLWMTAVLAAFGAATARRAAAWVLGGAMGFALIGLGSLSLAGGA